MRFAGLTMLAFGVVAVSPSLAAPPEVVKVIELPWKGRSELEAPDFAGGYFTMEESLSLRVDSDDRVSGTARTVARLHGDTYKSTFIVRGKYDGSDALALDLQLQSGDPLPDNMRWCSRFADLKIFSDPKRPGHYVVQGTIKETCERNGPKARIEYRD